ncbi:MAG: glutamate--tRNA ligase family protein [Zetaproteobacteria bacterium]|nr:glutamate--tRNA ligase family protein [Zetaproteobacteria bacterium]
MSWMSHPYQDILTQQLRALQAPLLEYGAPLRSRFAPSVTGQLHVGHLVHIWHLWTIMEALGGKVRIRLEDHDRQRYQPAFLDQLFEDLNWLGLWKHPVTLPDLWVQSERQHVYAQHLHTLHLQQRSYACACSRKQVAQRMVSSRAAWMHYDNACRDLSMPFQAQTHCWRAALDLVAPEIDHEVSLFGLDASLRWYSRAHVSHPCYGDPSLYDRHGQYTYFFCAVVDDLLDNIGIVVRGLDLEHHTLKQLRLRKLFTQDSWVPLFVHHPLLPDPKASRKLSKSLLAKSLQAYRREGASPQGLLEQGLQQLYPDLSLC